MSEMPKAYDPSAYEDDIYARWEASGFFIPENLPDAAARPPFTIVLPPPNATGTLHVGHAMMLANEDVMIRVARMRGRRALWLPGTDHAAIATQAKVEALLWKEEKKTRHDIGRAALLVRIDDFVAGSRERIRLQLRKMGSSLDWSREAFTLDAPRERAVRTIFKKMYDDGLIYRGDRVVNWCSRCASTLSDDELEYTTRDATLYYFKYAADFPITIATTQPETKLGDAAVAVHPSDARYQKFIGKIFAVRLGGAGGVDLKIKIIGEHTVEKDFGTGALGVTPAHSMVDYQMALAHDLPLTQIIGEDGLMTAAAGADYAHLTVSEARAQLVTHLRAAGLIEREEKISQNVPVCYRCQSEVNPLPKLQWFVGVNKKFAFKNSARAPSADLTDGTDVTFKDVLRHVVEHGQIKIIPERFNKIYFNWVDNLRDWCISRQIWYGHRIPVWYCSAYAASAKKSALVPKCAAPIVAVEAPFACPQCGGEVAQDPDTLDTWFSSGTWTFSTLGWPPTRVIFVRHGEAENNVKNILDSGNGGTTYHLTARGQEQVRAAAATCAAYDIAQIISSPVARARETAEILAHNLRAARGVEVSVRIDERLREVGLGEFDGCDLAAYESARAAQGNREVDGGAAKFWHGLAPAGVETYEQIRERTDDCLNELITEFAGRTIIVVSHGDPVAVMRAHGASDAEADKARAEKYPDNAVGIIREFGPDGSPHSDLLTYHPTDVLETGYDILSFWVARMILMTTYALGEVPFRTVYLHGLVRDEQGRKMSKSLGNVIDPLDVIPKYGTDAIRLSLLLGQTPGNDSRLSEEKIAGFRNFTNKLWNIARFIVAADDVEVETRLLGRDEINEADLTTLDQWILSRLAAVTAMVTTALEKYDFARAGETLRDFTWNDFADWYVEGAKVEGGKHAVLHFGLQQLLKLWHPFMPFVTETIWQENYAASATDFLMIAPWPEYESWPLYPAAEVEFGHVQNIVAAIRALRVESKIAPSATVPVTIVSKLAPTLAKNQPVLERLARAEILWQADGDAPAGQLVSVIDEGTIAIPPPETNAPAADRGRLELERDEVAHYVAALKLKLANADFCARAPAAVVARERAKLAEAEEKLQAIEKRLK